MMKKALVLAVFAVACGSNEKTASPPVMTPVAAVSPPVTPAGSAPPPDASAPEPQSPDVPWKVLVDLDARPAGPPVLISESVGKLVAPAGVTAVRKSAKECTGKGDAVMTADGGYEGAFTKKDAKEMLYLLTFTPCAKGGAATHTLLVLQGGHVNVNENVKEDDIVEVADLDQDGDNEILLLGTTGASTTARLVDTEDGKLETLFDFGEVASGDCSHPGPRTTSVISYRLRGSSMQYKAERKPRGPCLH